MTRAAISRIEPPSPSPAALASQPARSIHPGLLTTILLVLPAAALLLTPFGILAQAAIEHPELFAIALAKPIATAQLALGLAISILFCTLPFAFRSTDLAGASRTIPVAPVEMKAAAGDAAASSVVVRLPVEEKPAPQPLAA